MNRVLLSLAITVVLNLPTYGTLQRPDIIIYNGVVYELRTPSPNRILPLDTLWKDQKVKQRLYPHPIAMSSNCWRGYVAIWEIANDTLYLKGIDAWQEDPKKSIIPLKGDDVRVDPSAGAVKVDLRKLFPQRFKDQRIEADWFSGNLTLAIGGFNNVVEEFTLQFKNGKISANPKNSETADHGQLPDLSKYVCNTKFFSMPESVNINDINDVLLLVKANPDRYEPHIMLAIALVANHKIEPAINEFEIVDRLAAKVSDHEVLARLTYEDYYAMVLFIAAEQRLAKEPDGLKSLRMFQQVLGMDNSLLREKKILSRCYLYVAIISLTRGSYDSAIRAAEDGWRIAIEEDDTESMGLLEKVRDRAKTLREKLQRYKHLDTRPKLSEDAISGISSLIKDRPQTIPAPDHGEAKQDN